MSFTKCRSECVTPELRGFRGFPLSLEENADFFPWWYVICVFPTDLSLPPPYCHHLTHSVVLTHSVGSSHTDLSQQLDHRGSCWKPWDSFSTSLHPPLPPPRYVLGFRLNITSSEKHSNLPNASWLDLLSLLFAKLTPSIHGISYHNCSYVLILSHFVWHFFPVRLLSFPNLHQLAYF